MRARAYTWRRAFSLSHCPISMIKKENQMSKPGQTVGQTRDEVGQTDNPFYVAPGNPAWKPRTDGLKALLVSERTTVFDRPLPVVEASAEADIGPATALGPMPTTWTHDLVHCRLVLVYTEASKLPRILWPDGIRSMLGQLQPQPPGEVRRPLGEAELAVLDWTWTLVWRLGEDDRSIVRGFMAGAGLREIAAELKKLQSQGIGLGKGVSKDSVPKRYRTITSGWAEDWNRAEQPIDRGTLKVWETAARKQ